uniref:Uncharacterized protein n=1 Tax=Arundo donax TaxID=35708 RepID=A0A0A9HNQ1_ARUDO
MHVLQNYIYSILHLLQKWLKIKIYSKNTFIQDSHPEVHLFKKSLKVLLVNIPGVDLQGTEAVCLLNMHSVCLINLSKDSMLLNKKVQASGVRHMLDQPF